MSLEPLEADVHVDPTAIEKNLAELWRNSKEVADDALTRAALWNVVAHTSSTEYHTQASEVLGRASATVPQRTIIVRADPSAKPPPSSAPINKAAMATNGWMRVAEPVTRGPRMYASIAWPPTAAARARGATNGPLKTSAMSTASRLNGS